MNPLIDNYIARSINWQTEMQSLRGILLECSLTEELKWKVPTYTFNGKNVCIIGKFRDYVVLSFMKGVLLKDVLKLLQKPGKNSRSIMIFKFTSNKEILDIEQDIKSYIYEAIEMENAGLKVGIKPTDKLDFPEELLKILNEKPDLKKAFYALTPGRQRGYNLHFSGAKQSATRTSRVIEASPKISAGLGMQDCYCGQSKRYPRCDGSHKYL